jgi:regulator of protease activity HflC (stomatin/prohibitin superfamily)
MCGCLIGPVDGDGGRSRGTEIPEAAGECSEWVIRIDSRTIYGNKVDFGQWSIRSWSEFMLIAVAIVIVLGLSGLRVAQEYQRGVIFRLGRYVGLRGPGLYWIIPLNIERAVSIDIRTRTVSAEQQETITRDSVTIKVNAVLWYRIVDAAKSVIEVADAPSAVYQLALTGLRNIIGQHDLDEVLQERNKINNLLRESIVNSTMAWGLEVQRFEMKDVELPAAMQQVMAMQAEAIREKRARIIKAEAELEASVKLSAAAAQMMVNPAALELRRMQMISEVGAENNSTTVLMIPSDFVSLSHTLDKYLQQRNAESASQFP